jgi:phage virion morphogenesis protein
MQIDVEIQDEQVRQMLSSLATRINDMTPAMRRIAGIMADSVEENFERGGRPVRWPMSRRAEEESGQTLQKTGRLAGSLVPKATANEAIVGTNVKYAAVHQFGAKKGSFGTIAVSVKDYVRKINQAFGKQLKGTMAVKVRAHTRNQKLPWGNIPARPFMMIQDEDWDEIKASLADYIAGTEVK